MMDLDEVYLGADIAENITRVYRGVNLIFERGATLDPNVQAVIDYGTGQGYTIVSGTVLTALNTMVIKMKADGVWNIIDVLYCFATNGDSDFATIELKNTSAVFSPFQATKVNSPLFTPLEGFTGNGTSSYIDTGADPSALTNYSLNSVSAFLYERTNLLNQSDVTAGCLSGGSNRLLLATGFGPTIFRINNGNPRFQYTNTALPTSAFHHINRAGAGATTTDLQGYYNGANEPITNVAGSPVSTGVPTGVNAYVLARNNSGSPDFHAARQVSFFGMGGSLNATQASDLYDAIQAYMTTLGTQV